MGYADGHPIRLVGGRLALNFVNTADWSQDGNVLHEKIETLADLRAWADSVSLGSLQLPSDLTGLYALRAELRRDLLHLVATVASGSFQPNPRLGGDLSSASAIEQAITAAAAGLFIDAHEALRIKKCPGENCGWLFLDETGNGRRRWCSMETCGNRSKARRHHLRAKSVES